MSTSFELPVFGVTRGCCCVECGFLPGHTPLRWALDLAGIEDGPVCQAEELTGQTFILEPGETPIPEQWELGRTCTWGTVAEICGVEFVFQLWMIEADHSQFLLVESADHEDGLFHSFSTGGRCKDVTDFAIYPTFTPAQTTFGERFDWSAALWRLLALYT